MSNPCMYCNEEIEPARVEIGMPSCLACAKITTKKIVDAPVRMERLFRVSEKEQEVDDVEALAKVVAE
jgi:hypothetical protein